MITFNLQKTGLNIPNHYELQISVLVLIISPHFRTRLNPPYSFTDFHPEISSPSIQMFILAGSKNAQQYKQRYPWSSGQISWIGVHERVKLCNMRSIILMKFYLQVLQYFFRGYADLYTLYESMSETVFRYSDECNK
jgi:hypothetical protein